MTCLLITHNTIIIHIIQYEQKRTKTPNIISDVFDSPYWRKKMGPVDDNLRIALLFCIDAIQAFKKKGQSLMPAEFQILSLPPKFRTKPEFMLLSLLIPAQLKARAQKKYFDYVVETELNLMTTTGLPGPRGMMVKASVFGITLDLPGRDKFLHLRGRHVLCRHTV